MRLLAFAKNAPTIRCRAILLCFLGSVGACLSVVWMGFPRFAPMATAPSTAAERVRQTTPAPVASSRASVATFGSDTLLTSLWTPQELQSPYEPQSRRPGGTVPVLPVHLQGSPLRPLSPHGAIRWVKPAQNRPVVALTFDLCERGGEVSGYDAPVVNYLRVEKIRATFFAGGKWMQSHADKAMQLIVDPLFEIGNHSWAHENFRVITGASLVQQIQWTQEEYALLRDNLRQRALQQGMAPALVTQEMARIPSAPLTFRFPYGTCKPEALQALGSQGLQAIQWDVVSGDPAPLQTPQQIARTVLQQTKPGSIVIFHANGRGHGTATALASIIPALRARGFAFVTVSELLSVGEETVAPEECYELRPGDNRRYDLLSRKGSAR